MEKFDQLKKALYQYAQIEEEQLMLASTFFERKEYKKGECFNIRSSICRNLGFVTKGLFRIYYVPPQKKEEINLFFFCENQFMVSFKSFIAQIPCYYTIEAMEDSEVIQINHENLQSLFSSSAKWERFGRVLAEQYFYFSQARTESFIFQSAEQRYLEMLSMYPDIFKRMPLLHVASYLGIKSQSLSRIRARLMKRSKKVTTEPTSRKRK